MFNKAVLELYALREENKDDQDMVDSIDKIISELSTGISAVLDMLKAKGYGPKDHMN